MSGMGLHCVDEVLKGLCRHLELAKRGIMG
jgi:hypothetical protein